MTVQATLGVAGIMLLIGAGVLCWFGKDGWGWFLFFGLICLSGMASEK